MVVVVVASPVVWPSLLKGASLLMGSVGLNRCNINKPNAKREMLSEISGGTESSN